jgi:membrane protease YdiL (CAAX protease family)
MFQHVGRVLAGFVILDGPLVAMAWCFPPSIPAPLRHAAIAAWGIGGSILVQRWLFDASWRSAIRRLGIQSPRGGAIRLALVATSPLWLVAPSYAWATDSTLGLSPDLYGLLTGVILVNGLAEELVLRGFAFGRLREVLPFGRAAALSASLFAAQHLYLLAVLGSVAGAAAVVFAAIVAFPLAALFERGRSVWAPAAMHAAINCAGGLFVLPGDATTRVALLHMAAATAIALVVLRIARRYTA